MHDVANRAKRRLNKQQAMGIVFVRVGRATCIQEMYTSEPSFIVIADDLSALYGSGPTAAAAWIDAARNLSASLADGSFPRVCVRSGH
jgi:hypothetical protein